MKLFMKKYLVWRGRFKITHPFITLERSVYWIDLGSIGTLIPLFTIVCSKSKVTSATNQYVGLVIPKWDFSLRLAYAMDLVGGNETKSIDNRSVLNQGSYHWCDEPSNMKSFYCEFEHHFEADLQRALSIFTRSNVSTFEDVIQVLFVKPQGLDSVVITCRFLPPIKYHTSNWLHNKLDNLIQMVGLLYYDSFDSYLQEPWNYAYNNYV